GWIFWERLDKTVRVDRGEIPVLAPELVKAIVGR
ncbi:unnamed protein product, partial [marine sediment metagenome]